MTSDSEKRTSELEKQLLDAQDRLHQVESLAGIGHWSLDHRTQAFFISRHAESIMGIDQPHAELNFDDFISRVHPDDREGIERVFQDSVKQRTGYDISYRVLLTDGTIKYINERCRHEFDSSGRVNRSFGTLLDITKQLGNERQAQRDQRVLEKSEANFRDLVETSHDLICQLDDVGIFTYLNSAWEDVLGYKLEEMLGHNFTEFKEPEETAKMIPIYEGEREQVSDYETSYINKSGDRVILRFRTKPQNDIDGNRIGVQGTAYDITDQRRAEIALQESEKRFRDMFQSSSDAQLLVDSNGSILLVNAQTEITFGYTTSEITGSNLNRLIPERFDDHTKYMHEYFDNPKARRMSAATNLIGKNKDGEELNLEISLTPIEEGRLVLASVRDVSEKMELERQFLQAQKMESIGRLTGGIAHDLNNVLTVIIGFAEMGEASALPNSISIRDFQEIRKAGERASNMISQLMSYSRQQILQLQVVNLNDVILDMEDMLRRLIKENIQVESELDHEPALIEVDPVQIQQIIMNLIVNAGDAMASGGSLKIKTTVEYLDAIPDTPQIIMSSGRYVILSITDTGEGMTREVIANIFEPFFTTKEQGKGTGLGLSVVYGIVKQSRGYITVNSDPGEGTQFVLYFPVISKSVDLEPNSIQKKILPGTCRILLVEDDPDVRGLSKNVLESNGYEVLDVEDAEHAMAALTNSDVEFELMISDIVLPGVDGHELVTYALANSPTTRILLVSGYSSDIGQINSHDDIEFLQKPFDASSLLAKVAEIMQ